MAKAKKIAVVLFNLGGPTSPEAVRPFLFNLFNDKAIIGLPQPLRYFLAQLISRRRAPIAAEIYDLLGGKSPLLENTRAQARALEKKLSSSTNVKVFIAMRYWHPFASETVSQVKGFNPEQVVLLPLYPQFSTTTSASSLKDWQRQAKKQGLDVKTSSICCFPDEASFIRAHSKALSSELTKKAAGKKTRILFTAHGLPEKIVRGGDPYQWQVEKTVAAVLEKLKGEAPDYVICYQSRVGPLKWLEPSTEDEIIRAGREGKNLIVVPIAFVSEHSETLVELDIEYKKLAHENGIRNYIRVPTPGTSKDFIESLARLVEGFLDREGLSSFEGERICPKDFGQCPCGVSGKE